MENQIELYGITNSKGIPSVSGNERFKSFFAKYPRKRFIMQIMVLEPDNVTHHVWYIIKMIVPAFVRGMKDTGVLLTEKEAFEQVIETCPNFYKSHKERFKLFNWNKYQVECDMPQIELEMAIEWLHIYCLEHFNISISNTKSI